MRRVFAREAAVLAAALAVPLGAAAASSAPSADALAAFVERWRTLGEADPQRVAVLRAFAAAWRAPEADGVEARPAGVALEHGRAWPVAAAKLVGQDGAGGALRLATTPAATVVAPAAGTVVFADRVDGVGLVLITAHGDEYHSVLAGLGALDVGVGAKVAVGERIGRMAERADNHLELHLELRHDGRPVDPLSWLGVNSAGDGRS